MDLREADPAARARAGASQEAPGAELPLVVWLRGDEPHCADFTLDADEVMRQLGIRRSRLTQISGKELRVGRIRRGRYVSPVFRQEDVDQYLAWTRATASHLKSSSVLEGAAEALRLQGEALAERLETIPAELLGTVDLAVRTAAVETQRAMHERADRLERLPEDLVALAQAGALESPRTRDALASLATTLDLLLSRQETQALVHERLLGDVGELAGLVRITREDQATEAKAATRRQDSLTIRLTALEMELAELKAAVSQAPAKPRVRRGAADGRRVRRLVERDALLAPKVKTRKRRPPKRG